MDILLIDDDLDQLELISMVLKSGGFEVCSQSTVDVIAKKDLKKSLLVKVKANLLP